MDSASKLSNSQRTMKHSQQKVRTTKPRVATKLRTLDDLDDQDVPSLTTSFNTCTRSGEDRRQLFDRRATPRPDCSERRSGRDRRMMTYF